jgi:hypothetical protein
MTGLFSPARKKKIETPFLLSAKKVKALKLVKATC